MKKLILIGLLLIFCNIAEAKTVTLYCRSDTHKINGLTANILAITNNSTSGKISTAQIAQDSQFVASAWMSHVLATISIVHRDGSEDIIGTTVASTTTPITSIGVTQGVSSATFSCPKTTLVVTDAIKIVWNASIHFDEGSNASITGTWISGQLGWTKLNASTWTVYRYYYAAMIRQYMPPRFILRAYTELYYGDSTHTTYIDGIDYIETDSGYATIY